MTHRVRVTVEGDVGELGGEPAVGDAASVWSAPEKAAWRLRDAHVTAVEQITPPLTAEEALAEIELIVGSAPGRVGIFAGTLRDIIAKTKQPSAELSSAIDAANLEMVRSAARSLQESLRVAEAERDAARAALREIDEWAVAAIDDYTIADGLGPVVNARAIRERIAKVPGIGGEK